MKAQTTPPEAPRQGASVPDDDPLTNSGGRQGTPVRRRHVFYVPGYDPIHPRRYRELYRREARKQAGISGYQVDLRASRGAGHYGWQVTGRIDGATVEAEFEILPWTDIVRQSMGQSIAATYRQLARTAAIYIGTGTLFRLMRLRKGPILAALYPVGFLLLQLLMACAIGGGLALLFNWAAEGARVQLLDPWIGLIVGLAAIPLVLKLFKRFDGRFYAYYLMHDFAFAARHRGVAPPEMTARITAFRHRLAEVMQDTSLDEVLVVGHSSGAHLAISILAEMLRDQPPGPSAPRLGLLTLGQVVPMVSFLPGATRLRADLVQLSLSDRLFWLDVSAPGDGCCFALCDPVAVTGVAPAGQRWPLVISAAFTHTLAPETWRALRWRFFRLHFQYLCAFDRPGDYDYFRITAGPQSLGDAFAGRVPSKSRITRPVSRYRDAG